MDERRSHEEMDEIAPEELELVRAEMRATRAEPEPEFRESLDAHVARELERARRPGIRGFLGRRSLVPAVAAAAGLALAALAIALVEGGDDRPDIDRIAMRAIPSEPGANTFASPQTAPAPRREDAPAAAEGDSALEAAPRDAAVHFIELVQGRVRKGEPIVFRYRSDSPGRALVTLTEAGAGKQREGVAQIDAGQGVVHLPTEELPPGAYGFAASISDRGGTLVSGRVEVLPAP